MERIIDLVEALPQSIIVIIIIGLILIIGLLLAVCVHAYRSGGKVTLWGITIERGKKQRNENSEKINKQHFDKVTRISFFCSTTYEIENSKEKRNALKRFYKALLREIDRTTYGINSCGAEPLRSVILEHYCQKLASYSNSQMDQIKDKVRWYWYPGDNVGWSIEPALYDSVKAKDAEDRTIKDVIDSDVIIAFTGRTGAKEQLERILKYHQKHEFDINLNQRLLILLCWFGGSVEQFVKEHQSEITWILNKYSELEPLKKMDGWEIGDTPDRLASKLINMIPKLID